MIGNPAAGLRRRPGLLEDLRRRLEQDGIRASIHQTVGPGDAVRVARGAAVSRAFDAVLAVGGDGTVHEVANGLACSPVPLGVVPTGTMNILARELGLPLDPLKSVEGLRHFLPVVVTMGLAKGAPAARRGDRAEGTAAPETYFLLMAGAGFDAFALSVALGRAGDRKLTMLRYTLAALEAAGRFPFSPIELIADGEVMRGTSAIIGNVPRYGANLPITPRADPLDPFLDLCVFLGRGAPSYFFTFASLMLGGRHVGRRDVAYRKARRIEIREGSRTTEKPGSGPPARALVQMDGELYGTLPVTVEARPGALRILAPPGWPTARRRRRWGGP